MNVKIVKTGVANVASVSAAFSRSRDSADGKRGRCHDGRCLVLPGVGSFGAGMESLTEGWWMHCLGLRAGSPSAWACSG